MKIAKSAETFGCFPKAGDGPKFAEIFSRGSTQIFEKKFRIIESPCGLEARKAPHAKLRPLVKKAGGNPPITPQWPQRLPPEPAQSSAAPLHRTQRAPNRFVTAKLSRSRPGQRGALSAAPPENRKAGALWTRAGG